MNSNYLNRIERLWRRYTLAFKCRGRWCRRRKIWISDDPICVKIWDRCEALYHLKERVKLEVSDGS